jgi:hypothetical protein
MQITTKTTHTFHLDPSERFEWTKRAGAYAGHAFTVDEIRLEGLCVDMRGPWVAAPPNAGVDGHAEKGWQYMTASFAEEADMIRELPAGILEILAVHGLKVEL